MPTATPIIKTTSADRVQERRSESSRLCMETLSASSVYPHCDRDHKLRGSPVKTPSALQLAAGAYPARRATGPLSRGGRLDRLLPQKVSGRLIQGAPQLKAFVGAGEVAHTQFHSADDRLDADAGRSREGL